MVPFAHEKEFKLKSIIPAVPYQRLYTGRCTVCGRPVMATQAEGHFGEALGNLEAIKKPAQQQAWLQRVAATGQQEYINGAHWVDGYNHQHKVRCKQMVR
jgi:hypothetical protein